jgi:RHS repeat-associated protein
LTSITGLGVSYGYNDRGDLITETGGYTFGYDREGRLEEVKKIIGSDTNKFNFMYTSEGRRQRKVHYRDSSGVVESDTTYYIYDGMNVVAELDGSLDLKSKYVYANGMLTGRIDSDNELFQYFHDGLGSLVMICDSTGEYQNLYVYDDFGNFRMMEETGSVPNSYYYTGQERDESPSGLYNLRARYYASAIGRFTQEDPIMHLSISTCALFGTDPEAMFLFGIAQPQGLHGYSYVWNDPMNWIDPFGLERKEWWEKLEEGCYYGTGFGEDAAEWYAWQYVQNGSWYYAFGGGWASLWTPDTWLPTSCTLVSALLLSDWAHETGPWAGKIEPHGPHAGGPHQYPHLQFMIRIGKHTTKSFRIPPHWFMKPFGY